MIRGLLREYYYLAIYLACYLIGFFYRPSNVIQGSHRPIVLVPGFLGRSLSFYRLRRRLIEKGHPVYLIDLGFQVGDIRSKARQVADFLKRHDLKDCYYIGFSLGGFIGMALNEESKARIRHFITLGTGFQGALSSYLILFCITGWQIRPGSAHRRSLMETAKQTSNLTNIAACSDEIVIPANACRLGIQREIVVPEFGHINLIMGRRTLDLLAQTLEGLELQRS